MLILLPPSETKRDGGDPSRPLDLGSLSFSQLTPQRTRALDRLRRLSRSRDAAAALKLGPTQASELERNKLIATAPTMTALDRFDGVLYDGLDAATLSASARAFAQGHLVIASALFGLISPDDRIPAYRLSPDSRLPGTPLTALWKAPVSAALSTRQGMILDLRSEAYRALGPIPQREQSWYLRVVAEAADGRRRALNHFNKKGKGEFTRALLTSGLDHADANSLLEWAAATGFRLEFGSTGEVDLVV